MKAKGMAPFAALLAACVLPAGAPLAQQEGPEAAEARERIAEVEEHAFAREMKEAEERLAEAAKRVAELSARRLDDYGEARQFEYRLSGKPRLGVNIDTAEAGAVDGVKVLSVTPGSAADDAGLRAGDVIASVNGESLSADSRKAANGRLLDFMAGVEEGDAIRVEYLRGGKSASVEIEPRPVRDTLMVWTPDGGGFGMPRPPDVMAAAPLNVERFRYAFGGWRGGWGDMEVVELSEGLGRYFGTDEGLLVVSAPGSNEFKLEDGDVIQSIDGRKPESVDHCMRILASYQPGETLELTIMRDQRRQTLRVEMPDTRTSHLAPLPPGAPLPPAAP